MDKAKRFETVLVIVVALIALYWFKRHNALLISAMFVGLAALLVPAVATGLHWLWMKLADVMGIISGKVILSVLYMLVLVPLALLSRMFGKKALRLKTGGVSYYKERNHTYTREDLMHPW